MSTYVQQRKKTVFLQVHCKLVVDSLNIVAEPATLDMLHHNDATRSGVTLTFSRAAGGPLLDVQVFTVSHKLSCIDRSLYHKHQTSLLSENKAFIL